MVLHDSLSRRKRELPPPPGPIRMYVCGPTVYQRIHVGNVRPYDVSSGWSPVEERNHEFLTGERTPEGYFRVEGGIEPKIARASATRRTPT